MYTQDNILHVINSSSKLWYIFNILRDIRRLNYIPDMAMSKIVCFSTKMQYSRQIRRISWILGLQRFANIASVETNRSIEAMSLYLLIRLYLTRLTFVLQTILLFPRPGQRLKLKKQKDPALSQKRGKMTRVRMLKRID